MLKSLLMGVVCVWWHAISHYTLPAIKSIEISEETGHASLCAGVKDQTLNYAIGVAGSEVREHGDGAASFTLEGLCPCESST